MDGVATSVRRVVDVDFDSLLLLHAVSGLNQEISWRLSPVLAGLNGQLLDGSGCGFFFFCLLVFFCSVSTNQPMMAFPFAVSLVFMFHLL